MKQEFSQELIARMVAYAQKKWNLRISDEEAAERLRSLANLYLITSKIRARKHKQKSQSNQSHAG